MIRESIKKHNESGMHHLDTALGTALYILRGLDEGQNKYEITRRLDNNERLVIVWIQYLKAIGWRERKIRLETL
jgi:hypothetical protein